MAKKVGVDCVVIGDDIAGFFATTAGQRGRKVRLRENSDKVGKKF